jgi:ligand-binding sensor domain-containing protein
LAINYKLAGIGAIAVAAALAGAYGLGRKQGESAAPQPTAAAHPPVAGGVVPVQMPDGQPHPPIPQQGAHEGAVAPAQPGDRFSHFRVGNKNVKSIYVDDKTVWVGTSGGVIRYDTGSDNYKVFDARNGLLSNGIFFVGKIQGRITVGTYGGGMSMYDEAAGKWETFNIPEGLGDAFVYDVLQARNGDIWIATWSGVNRVRGGALRDRSKWDLYTVENTKGGVPNDWVYGLAEGRNGDIWLATEGGLALYRDAKWSNWNHAKGLGAPYEKVKDAIAFKNDPGKASLHHARQKEEMGLTDVDQAYNPNYIVAIEVDANGVVWVGTWGGGLGRYDGKSWTNYTTVEGLPGNHVFSLHIDPKGQLWVGTNNGLALAQPDSKYKVLNTNDGLFANTVFSMTTAADGSRWIGSFGGVAHLYGE